MKLYINHDKNGKNRNKKNSDQKLKPAKNGKKVLNKSGKVIIDNDKLKSGKKLNIASPDKFKGKDFILKNTYPDVLDADDLKSIVLKDAKRVIL